LQSRNVYSCFNFIINLLIPARVSKFSGVNISTGISILYSLSRKSTSRSTMIESITPVSVKESFSCNEIFSLCYPSVFKKWSIFSFISIMVLHIVSNIICNNTKLYFYYYYYSLAKHCCIAFNFAVKLLK